MNIAVIGTGAYSLALAIVLAKHPGNKIIMWSESKESLKELSTKHTLEKALPGINLPKNIKYTTSYEEALENANIIFVMVAAKYLDNVIHGIKPYFKKDMCVCIGTKGIEQDTCKFAHEIVHDILSVKNLSVISGPSFAIDIANNDPIGLSIASTNKKTTEVIKSVLCCDTFKLRKIGDILGVEICGSIKNIIAIAAGIIDGLGYSVGTQAFLITESMHDIKNLIVKLGGKRKTIITFAGIGDLLMTCTSSKSRNFTFGTLIAKGDKKEIDDYLNTTTVEGFYTLKSIYNLLRKKKVDMPIIDLIYDIIINDKDPNKLIDFLVNKK